MTSRNDLEELALLARELGDTELETKALEKLTTENKSNSSFDYGVNLIRQINEGILLGFGDEIEAAIASVGKAVQGQDIKEAYSEQLKAIRATRQQFKEENPVTGVASEFAGGLFTAGLGGVKLASKIPQASANLKAAVAAAPTAAVAGAGASDPDEDLEFMDSMTERVGGALKGAAAGVFFGSLTPKASKVISDMSTGAAAKTRQAFKGAETKALRKIAEATERDSLSVSTLMRKKAVMGKDATLADLGDSNMSDLLETIAQQPGNARNKVQKALMKRLQNQRGRIKDLIKSNVHPEAENLDVAKEAIQKQMKTLAKPIYDEALSTPVAINDTIDSILKTPAVSPMIRKAISTAKSDTDLPEALKKGLDPDSPNMVVLDYVVKEMSDRIQKTLGTNKGRILTSARQKLVKELDEQVPIYEDARKVWSDGAKQLDAMQLGQDIFKEAKKGVSNVNSIYTKMSQSEKEMFKLGASNEMMRIMDNVSDTLEGRPSASLLKRIFSTPAQKQAIETIIDDAKGFRQFQRALNAERSFINNSNKALSNSATAKRIALQADSQLDVSDAAELAQGRMGGIYNILTKMFKGNDLNEKTRSELAKRLTANDAKDIKATLLQANRQGSLLPQGVEKALKLDDWKFTQWVRSNPERAAGAIAKATGITAAIEAQ
jgi:hypothetical protein